MEKLSEETAWKLAKVYGNMYEAFKRSITYVNPTPVLPPALVCFSLPWRLAAAGTEYSDMMFCREPEEVFAHCPDLDSKTKEVLLSVIQRRLTSQPIKIRADIDVQCYEYAGIDAIKEALYAGIAKGNENSPVKVRCCQAHMRALS